MADWIIRFFPKHHSYLEPFFGSGAVLFNKPRSNIETVNDLDCNVVNLFECIRENPENVGLIYYYPETGKLLKKRRAVYRKIEEPVGVYKYIIYSRLDQERIPFYEDRAEYAKDYLADQSEKRKIGRDFGSKMAKDLKNCQERLERLSDVEGRLEQLRKIEEILEKHQILGWRWYRNLDDTLKDLDDALSSSYPKELGRVEDDLQRALDNLRRIKESHMQEVEGSKI